MDKPIGITYDGWQAVYVNMFYRNRIIRIGVNDGMATVSPWMSHTMRNLAYDMFGGDLLATLHHGGVAKLVYVNPQLQQQICITKEDYFESLGNTSFGSPTMGLVQLDETSWIIGDYNNNR